MHQAPDHTRVVFDTSGPVDYRLFTLEGPRRVVVDLRQTSVRRGFATPPVKGDVIEGVRRAPRGRGAGPGGGAGGAAGGPRAGRPPP
ncbi:MAG: AMIN domain-containing protein, partial [Gammaproteobacteria bacterium]|nr:AMIN domain-containing protein [Gammaproteobacteria bacterium]